MSRSVPSKSTLLLLKEKIKQRKMKKKFYQTPVTDVLEFEIESQLLAGTGQPGDPNFDPTQGIDLETGEGGGGGTIKPAW